ncbi:Copine-8 isoform 1 [Schistosoma japonicum]|uniref:Copine-3 n=1 Tax=Schistosoma japonicum TaxID=6182 RepID=A0A4Z2CTT5_SCHJA|nr:Copine-8 isoform 1 [Schistosoma japonicum]
MDQDISYSTTVELSIACRNLCDTDVLSKSDPLVVVFEKSFPDNQWVELDRTEIIQNNLNPDFAKKVVMEYHFEEQQRLNFAVYDVDCKSDKLDKHDFLGNCETTLGEIASSGRIIKPLKNGPSSNCGSIISKYFICSHQRYIFSVSAEEVSSCKDELTLDISGRMLDKKDIFGSSDPFLAFYRVNEDGSRTVVYRTKEIRNTLNPNWEQMIIPLRVLCNGDHDRPLVIACIDWNRSGRESLIGEITTSANELLTMFNNGIYSLDLINPHKAKRHKHYQNSGTLHLNLVRIEKVYSFLEYVQGGTELSCCIAIDFTASNGSPQVPGTLHYSTISQPSQYAVALQAVGEIISDYDSDNLFPSFGFGACIPPDNNVSHCFPLNGHMDNPYCKGIQGAMAAYAHSLRTVKFHGPTNFAPIINTVASIARQSVDGSQYSILLILTDGIISDLPQTKAAIVNASSLPLSIIIVGVGPANFDEMEELDGDEVRLSSRGKTAIRDIVQFVPFRNFHQLNNVQESKRRLTKAVLSEIPDQLVSYMRMQGIKPLNTQNSNDYKVEKHKSEFINSSCEMYHPDKLPNAPPYPTDLPNPPYPNY